MAGKPVSKEDLCSHVLTGLGQPLNMTFKLHELTFDEMHSVLLNHAARFEQNLSQDNNFEANMALRQIISNWNPIRNNEGRNHP